MVSVIMPAFNVESYIDEAIKSILSQTYKKFELIIVEDGSTDKTLERIKTFNDPRIKLIIHGNNKGVVAARNSALKASTGDYIACLDADDISYPNRLEIQIKNINKKNVDLVCSNYFNENVKTGTVTENNSPIFSPNETKSYMFFYDITNVTVLFKKNILTGIEPVYMKRAAEDYDLFVRLAKNYKFYNIPKNLVKVRIRNESLCGQAWETIKEDIDNIRINQLSNIDIKPSFKESLIHIALIDKNYKKLSKYSIKEIFAWISKIVKANNQRKTFPNPYFNDEWQLRVSHSLKYREKRTIRNVINYFFLTKLLGHKSHLRNLIYLYKYKHSFNY